MRPVAIQRISGIYSLYKTAYSLSPGLHTPHAGTANDLAAMPGSFTPRNPCCLRHPPFSKGNILYSLSILLLVALISWKLVYIFHIQEEEIEFIWDYVPSGHPSLSQREGTGVSSSSKSEARRGAGCIRRIPVRGPDSDNRPRYV